SPQQGVLRAIHRAHASLADALLEGVLTEALRAPRAALEALDDPRPEGEADGGEDQDAEERPHGRAHDAERLEGFAHLHLRRHAELMRGEPHPGAHDRSAAVAGVSVHVDAALTARGGLGHAREGAPVSRRERASIATQIQARVPDLDAEHRALLRTEEAPAPQLALEAAA